MTRVEGEQAGNVGPGTGDTDDMSDTGEARPGRRRRPDQSGDDTDAGWGEQEDQRAHDRWLEEQRPPHWQ